MSRFAILLTVFFLCPSTAFSAAFEDCERIRLTAQQMRSATVRIYSGSDTSSGVLIGDGTQVLTVAHGIQGNQTNARIQMFDSDPVDGRIVFRDPDHDLAVIRLPRRKSDSESGLRSRPGLRIASAPLPESGSLVLAAGYPGREKSGSSPVIRIGALIAAEANIIRSSAALTVGDSGGPLINAAGELIGIHRQIGAGIDSNVHIPSNVILSVLEARGVSVENARTGADASISRPVQTPLPISLRLPTADPAVNAAIRRRTVHVVAASDVNQTLVLGTILDDRHVATKLSALPPQHRESLQCRQSDRRMSTAVIILAEESLDLAILQIEDSLYSDTATPDELQTPDSDDTMNTDLLTSDTVVFAAAPDGTGATRPGILTRTAHADPAATGKLGAILETGFDGHSIRVRDVAPNSTAMKAGLVHGDVISLLSGQSVQSLDEFARTIRMYQPGDWLTFEILRSGQSMRAVARYEHDPAFLLEKSEYLDGRSGLLSERRTGFMNVLQHDVPIAPEQCGGPVCDCRGRVIGINIARRSREATLALPVTLVREQLRGVP